MDFCRNVSVPGDQYQQEQVLSTPPCSKLCSLDDLFPAQETEVDVSLEWLSIFVEDCLSSRGICVPVAETHNANVQNPSTAPPKSPKPLQKNKPQQEQQAKTTPPSLEKFVVPGKVRSKRKRATSTRTTEISWAHHFDPQSQPLDLTSSDPPLLQQAYWLADSELILPKKEDTDTDTNTNTNKLKVNDETNEETKKNDQEEAEGMEKNLMEGKEVGGQQQQQQPQPRRCTHCLAQRTPQWRAGPLGPKTLCNACGVRYKSGRLLPEYRPAKSPTFVSYLHSNSHKKVMEMRMAVMSSLAK